jgi:hypothetical protein
MFTRQTGILALIGILFVGVFARDEALGFHPERPQESEAVLCNARRVQCAEIRLSPANGELPWGGTDAWTRSSSSS